MMAFSTSAMAVVEKRIALDQDSRLDYLAVEVNGELKHVAAGQELDVVKGDEVKLIDAALTRSKTRVSNVNLIGYQPERAPRGAEDRGFVIRTAQDLRSKWSVDKSSELYRIEAFSGNTLHGEAFLRVLPMRLRYVELTINKESRVLRESELVRVKASDEFKVTKVYTNVEDDEKKVNFQVVPVQEQSNRLGIKFYEILFSRNDVVFARIPLQVEGS